MNGRWGSIVGVILVALLAGALGAWGGERMMAHDDAPQGMHVFVHNDLDLSSQQRAQLAALERDFGIQRRSLDFALRSANAALARAIENEHRNGPQVEHAVETVHARMGDVEKATIAHLFAMRGMLDARQRAAFDERVTRSLTADPE